MGVSTQCIHSRSGVTVDYSNGEYLSYRVCLTAGGGATNDGLLFSAHEDDLGDPGKSADVILDETNEVSPSCREATWPSADPWAGNYGQVLVLTFVRAKEYRYQIKLMNAQGQVKEWIRDCTYTRSKQTDTKTVRLGVKVK